MRWPLVAAATLVPAIAGAVPVPLGPEFQVNTYTPGYQTEASVGADPGGRFVVVWSTGGNESDVVGQRYDAAGVPDGGEFQINTYTTAVQGQSDVATDALGNFVVVWISYAGESGDPGGGIRARRFDAGGTPLGDQFVVNTYTPNRQSVPRVAMREDGSFVVAWASILGPDPEESDGVQARFYDTAGLPVGDQIQVNSYTTGHQGMPDVAIDPLGRALIVWESNGSLGNDTSATSVQARRFNRFGTPLGPQFQVNSYTTSYQATPTAAFDGSGSFVVTWADSGGQGTDENFAIQARRFDAAAAPQGDAFQVNTYTTDNQGRPGVVAAAGGAFVVVWTSGRAGKGYSDFVLRGQAHDATGARAGEEFAVSTHTTIVGYGSGIAAVPDGGFIVSWAAHSSTGSDTSYGSVQARRFAEPTTTTVSVATTTTSTSTSLPPQPVAGAKLLLSDKGETKRRLALRLADGSPATVDPTIGGALLQVHGTGGGADNACIVLHAGGWSAKGRPSRRRYVYDACTGGSALCVHALLRPGKRLAAKARGALAYSLDEPQQGAVGVRFDGGGAPTCALFGGRVKKDVGGAKGRFLAKAAPAGAGCQPSPPCP